MISSSNINNNYIKVLKVQLSGTQETPLTNHGSLHHSNPGCEKLLELYYLHMFIYVNEQGDLGEYIWLVAHVVD